MRIERRAIEKALAAVLDRIRDWHDWVKDGGEEYGFTSEDLVRAADLLEAILAGQRVRVPKSRKALLVKARDAVADRASDFTERVEQQGYGFDYSYTSRDLWEAYRILVGLYWDEEILMRGDRKQDWSPRAR